MPYQVEPVIYREPNWNENLVLEEYGIYVDLKVEVRGREVSSNATANKRTYFIEWTSSKGGNSSINFFSGSEIAGSKRRFLTTNYTNTFLGDIVDGNGTNELFGIESIDIEYNAYYVPQVTIKFVDIRGASLFAQTELSHSSKYNNIGGISNEDVASSFFNCFFTFPYPRYTLLVKGFYGEPASYTLNCIDFRAIFDAESGNFQVVCKFVGFTFSFLNDISVNALLAAPYSDKGGREYWKARQQDTNGDFYLVSKNGERVEIPTMGELLVRLAKVDEKIDAAVSETEAAKKQRELSDKLDSYSKLDGSLETYANTLAGISWDDFKVFFDQKKRNFAFLSKSNKRGDELTDEMWSDDSISIPRNALIENLKNCGITDELIIQEIKDKPKRLEILKDTGSSLKVGDILDLDKFADLKTVIETAINGRYDEYKEYTHGYRYSIDIDDTFKEEIPKLKDELKANEESMREEEEKAMANILGFLPTVYNFTKIIMSHVEVLMKLIMDCAISIYDNPDSRTIEALNMSDVESDFRKESGDFIPPFPLVAKHKEANRNMSAPDNSTSFGTMRVAEEEWVGDISPKFQEADYVIGLMNGAMEVGAIINQYKQLEESGNTDNGTSGRQCAVQIPIIPTDMVITDTPFGYTPMLSDGEFAGRMFLRMYQIFGMFDDNEADADVLGTADAINFYVLNPSKSSHIAKRILEQNQGASENLFKFDEYIKPIVHNMSMKEEYKVDGVWPWQLNSNADGRLATNEMTLNLYHNKEAKSKNLIVPMCGKTFSGISGDLQPNGTSCRLPQYWNGYIPMSDFMIVDGYAPGSLDAHGIFAHGGNLKSVKNELVFKIDDAYLDYTLFLKQIPEEVKDIKDNFKGCSYEDDRKAYKVINDKIFDKLVEGDVDMDNPENLLNLKVKTIPPYSHADIETMKDFSVNLFTEMEYALETDIKKKACMFLYAIATYVKSDIGLLGNALLGKFFKEDLNFIIVPKWIPYYLGARIWDARNDHAVQRGTDEIFENNPPRKEVIDALYESFISWADGDFKQIDEQFCIKYTTTISELAGKEKEYSTITKILTLGACDEKNHSIDLEELVKYVDVEDFKSKFKVDGSSVNFSPRLKGFSVEFNKELSTTPINRALLMPIMMTFTVHNKGKFTFEQPKIDVSKMSKYWDAFIKKLQELYAGNDPNSAVSGGTGDKTPTDLKIAFYHYSKIFYDRWVAGCNMDEDFENTWKLSAFFDPQGNRNGKFHFIDSFYNDIGDFTYVNPQILVENILSCTSEDEYTLLTLLSDFFSKNRFKFLCMENFKDLSDPSRMDELFKPVSYVDMKIPENNIDFVCLYTYEYSSHADVSESDEYIDDSFMLNNKDLYPLPVQQKDKTKDYPLPAFGVAYGMQNQNYFMNVNVSMEKPMVTEQALLVQYKLCGIHSDIPKETKYITYGQDLFTIYANNSYTCNVEMMGDAWIQPTMYFCLTNVPMFRGSYLIEKVKHSITPGDMKTTFTGVRMANTSTRIARNWIKKSYISESVSLNGKLSNISVGGNSLSSYGGGGGAPSEGGYTEGMSYANGTWEKAVSDMGKWYQANIHTYQGTLKKPRKGRTAYSCPLVNGKRVYDDCTGFVTACLMYFGVSVPEGDPWHSAEMVAGARNFDKNMVAAGFVRYNYSFETLKPFDIIYRNGHAEIYAGKSDKYRSWGWGSVHDGIDGRSAMPSGVNESELKTSYKYIYRKQ